ncbi:MAG TPA: hypothetical protein VJB18_07445, partial [Burkholderiales bacterium]|nr:hypothetical protein [Burkholderiales bacterium]
MPEVEQRRERLPEQQPRATAAPGVPALRGTRVSYTSHGAVAERDADKVARIPIKVVPQTPLRKPTWIRARAPT